MIKCNKNTKKLYYYLTHLVKIRKGDNDQIILREGIRRFKKEISVKELPMNEFPSGCEYFRNNCNLFYDEIESMNFI